MVVFFSSSSQLPSRPLYVTDWRGISSGYCYCCDEYSNNLHMERNFGTVKGYCPKCMKLGKWRSF